MEPKDARLDTLLKEIGQLGKFQQYVTTLIFLAIALNACLDINFVLVARNVAYRCKIHSCDEDRPEFLPKWLPSAVPYKNGRPAKCEKFVHHNGSEALSCTLWNFDNNVTEKCDSFVYKSSERSIIQDFNLHCEDNLWKLTLVGTMNAFGQFVGLPIAGFISDRFGRRTVLVWGMVLSGIAGLARSFVNSYVWFVVLEFLDSAFGAGAYSCGFILGVELVGPSKRVLVSTIISSSYTVGEVITGGVAWLIQSWRPLTQILYSLAPLLFFYLWLTPESIRWLLARKRFSEAIAILQKAAKVNGKTISEENLSRLCSVDEKSADPVKYPLFKMFKSVILVMRFITCCFCWITCVFLFYGLTLNSVSLSGNSYLDFILTSLVEIPGYILMVLVVDKMGRRKSECGAFLFTSVCCVAFIFISEDIYWLKLLIYLLGKSAATMAFSICYTITSEIFPTSLRHSLMATCSMVGRIGSMVAPQMPLLEQIWSPFPLVLFASMAGIAAFLTLLFPETVNTKLPDTIEEAENIGK